MRDSERERMNQSTTTEHYKLQADRKAITTTETLYGNITGARQCGAVRTNSHTMSTNIDETSILCKIGASNVVFPQATQVA